MEALNIHKISTSLILRSEERENHLLYIVEIEENKKVHLCLSSENYFQALLVAKRIFSKLKTKQDDIGDFEVIVEAQQGRGITYDVNEFSFDSNFANTDDFYKELCNEFETRKFVAKLDNNTLFRKMIQEQKLNEYQEQQFLAWIKKLS
jgi:hypothetical protein